MPEHVSLDECRPAGKLWLSWSPQADGELRQRLATVLGVPAPEAGAFTSNERLHCLWLSPADWLVLLQEGGGQALLSELEHAMGTGACIACDATDALQQIELTGPGAAALLNKGCAIDFRRWSPGAAARCRFADISAIVQQTADSAYRLLWDSSFSHYVMTWLSQAKGD